jgi:hypothetical protein
MLSAALNSVIKYITIPPQLLFRAKFLVAKVTNSNMLRLIFLVHRGTVLALYNLSFLMLMQSFGSWGHPFKLTEDNFNILV